VEKDFNENKIKILKSKDKIAKIEKILFRKRQCAGNN